jgi:hypothetical protein
VTLRQALGGLAGRGLVTPAVGRGRGLLLAQRAACSAAGQPLEFAGGLFGGDRTRVVVWT